MGNFVIVCDKCGKAVEDWGILPDSELVMRGRCVELGKAGRCLLR